MLKLQEGLQSHKVGPESSFEPLVWFFAIRGDAWRAYGYSVTKAENESPTAYVSSKISHFHSPGAVHQNFVNYNHRIYTWCGMAL
jgi:hypothetical protein